MIPLVLATFLGVITGALSAYAWGFGPLGMFIATWAAATAGCLAMGLMLSLRDLHALADRQRAFLQPGE